MQFASLAQCSQHVWVGGRFEDLLGSEALEVGRGDSEVRRSRKLAERCGQTPHDLQ